MVGSGDAVLTGQLSVLVEECYLLGSWCNRVIVGTIGVFVHSAMNWINSAAVTDRMLRIFLAAAQHGSFSAAARSLGVGQPAVSHAVSAVISVHRSGRARCSESTARRSRDLVR